MARSLRNFGLFTSNREEVISLPQSLSPWSDIKRIFERTNSPSSIFVAFYQILIPNPLQTQHLLNTFIQQIYLMKLLIQLMKLNFNDNMNQDSLIVKV